VGKRADTFAGNPRGVTANNAILRELDRMIQKRLEYIKVRPGAAGTNQEKTTDFTDK
jgi:hypothetical protein